MTASRRSLELAGWRDGKTGSRPAHCAGPKVQPKVSDEFPGLFCADSLIDTRCLLRQRPARGFSE